MGHKPLWGASPYWGQETPPFQGGFLSTNRVHLCS